MSEDYQWFVDNYDDLCNQYGNSFLAIKNKEVICSYKSYADAVRETRKSEVPGTFIVQECLESGEMQRCCIASMNFI